MRLYLIGFALGGFAIEVCFQKIYAVITLHDLCSYCSYVPSHALPHLCARAMQICFQLGDRKACDLRNLFVTPLVQHLQREHRALVVIELCQGSLYHLIEFFIEELVHRHGRLIAQIKDLIVI